ncbi:hypothetical protein DJ91_5217 [Priestia megaterium]|nr:hypothetical protein DJ91_5217 [Priestia megaterium]
MILFKEPFFWQYIYYPYTYIGGGIMKLNGLKLSDSDSKEILQEMRNGKKHSPEAVAFIKSALGAPERRKNRRKFL